MPTDVVPVKLRSLWATSCIACVIGLALAIELTIIHVRAHNDPNARSFCTLNEHVSCDRVARSSFAVVADVPLSLWGAFAYIVLLILSLWGWRSRRPYFVAPFVVIAGCCAASSVALSYISGAILANVCLLCIGTWLVDWVLFIVGLEMARRIGLAELRRHVHQLWVLRRTPVLATMALMLGGMLAMRAATPEAWSKGRVSRVVPGAKLADNSSRLAPNVRLASGTDDAGHPYIGAIRPRLTISEFADYQCPHCAIAHIEMRELVARNADAIRVVHRHFPLDQQCNPLVQRPFHTRACAYAKLAACAALMGKFWNANDYLFDHGREEAPITTESLAKAVNLDAGGLQQCVDTAGLDVVKQDINEGLQLKIAVTPSFIVDGEVYKGELPKRIVARYGY